MIRPITKEALELLEEFEGAKNPKAGYRNVNGVVSYVPYLDPVGIPTIGIGTIAYEDGRRVKLSDSPITKERAYQLLNFELTEKADTVHKFLQRSAVLLSDQQYSALVSFAYNCGCGPIIDSGRSLHEAVKSDNIFKIADALLLYNKGTKKFGPFKRVVELPGLTRRRKAERFLFLNGVNNFYEGRAV